MGSWSDVLEEVQEAKPPLDQMRADALQKLAGLRNRNVILYYSGWLQKPNIEETSITDSDMNGFMNAVCRMDKSKGLDLVLHTPGGDLAATESIVNYFRDCFGSDVCAIVPHMSMSAGTMIACSCREIIMGKESSLGPTDPQMGGVAAGAVIEEFEKAVNDVEENPASLGLWGQIIGKYPPTFLVECQKVVDMSKEIIRKWLSQNMLKDSADNLDKALTLLCDHSESVVHNRHFSHHELEDVGLNIRLLEDDDALQDAVLTLHHLYMITFQETNAIKLIESPASTWAVSTA